MTKQNGKILIVDDDEDILVAGKLLLKRHYGSVVTCNKPEHVPHLMAAHKFDAILLDMNSHYFSDINDNKRFQNAPKAHAEYKLCGWPAASLMSLKG